MKTCSKCKEEKPYTEFQKNKGQRDGYSCQCKSCLNTYNKTRYHDESSGRKDYLLSRHGRNKTLVARYKRLCGCKLCGEQDPIVLDLHHLNPDEKDADPSKLLSCTREKVKTEIRKCVVLCANCHRRVHAGTIVL